MALTRRLVDSGKLLGVDVLDHIVIGDGRYVSFRESAHQARASWTTRRRPGCRRRGFDLTTIWTSCPSLVRRRISRSLEKFVSRPLSKADTLG